MAAPNDLTQGKIGRKLLLFALPMLLSSLVQQLYNTVDLLFAGNMLGTSASAAIGASSLLITCLVGFFGGLSVGAGVAISQLFGAHETEKLRRAIHNAMALCLAGSLLFFAIGYLAAPFYLRLVNTPEELQASALGYLRIYFLSFFSLFLYNIGSGILRALGNSQTPLYAQLLGGILNVLLDYVFLRFLTGGVGGVAWATLISQTAAALVVLRKLRLLDQKYALRLRHLILDGGLTGQMLSVGIPAGAQSLVITLSNVMAQYHINAFGETAIAAFTAYFKVELILYLPIVAFGQAVMAFAGQCKGAGNLRRIQSGTRICLTLSMALAAGTAAIAIPLGKPLFLLFNRDAEVAALGCRIISVTFPFYWVYSILQILGDSLRGCGEVKGPMWIILMNICLVRTGLLFWIVPQVQQVEGIAVTYPITWGLTACCMIGCFVHYHKRLAQEKRIQEEII